MVVSMNERIQKFAEMHGFVNEHMTPGEKSDALKKYEKFAELIVKECLAIIQTEVSMKYKDGWEQHGVSDDWATGHYNASLHSCALLKRHFGVEE
jgi:hypothetical protein